MVVRYLHGSVTRPTIAMTLLTHPMALRTTALSAAQPVRINVTRSNVPPSESNTVNLAPTYAEDRGRTKSRDRRRRPEGRSSSRQPAHKQMDIQCMACAMYGRSMKECKFFPRVAACIEYMNQHPMDTKETLTRYKKIVHPNTKKAAKDSYLKVLDSSCLPEDSDFDDLADQVTNPSSWNDGSDDYSVSISNIVHQINSHLQPTEITHPERSSVILNGTDTDVLNDIQPVKYPDEHLLRMRPTELDNIGMHTIPSDALCISSNKVKQTTHRISQAHGQCARVDARRD